MARVVTAENDSYAARRLNSRELLYYTAVAALVLTLMVVTVALIWFSLPQPNPDDLLTLDAAAIPPQGSPQSFLRGRVYLAHTAEGLIAFHGDTPGIGCQLLWAATNQRFEERCHGFKFRLDGSHIEGMVEPQDLERYPVTLTFIDDTTVTSNDAGDAIPLNGREVTSLMVDLREPIRR